MQSIIKRFFCQIILVLGVMIFMSTQAKPIIRYDIAYEVHYMSCAVEVNQQTIFNTALQNLIFPNRFTFRHGVTQYINQGKNLFSVRVDDAAYFLRKSHAKDAYCRVSVIELSAPDVASEPEHREVFSLTFKIKEVEDDSGNKKPIIITKGSRLNGREMAEGNIYFEKSRVQDIYGDQSIIVTLPTYSFVTNIDQQASLSWVQNATPVKDTPDIREKALAKYKELQIAIENSQWEELKDLLEPALTEMAELKFMTRDAYFDLLKKQVFNSIEEKIKYGGWEADVFNPKDYTFKIYTHGKLFNYYHLRNNEASPTSWTNGDTRTWFSPTLIYINGEVKVGAF